jgi:hypothetical protein
MKDETHSMPEQHCVCCGSPLDAATEITAMQGAPKPGDVSMCINCGEVMEFDKDLKLVPATVKSMLEIGERARAVVGRAQKLIRRRK